MQDNKNFNEKQIIVNGKLINYTILDPSGNVTALVSNTDIDVSDIALRKKINDTIIKANREVEQVGFLTQVNKGIDGKMQKIWKIQMAGDEFCGNASRAFACYLFDNKLVDDVEFPMMCSGNDNILTAKIDINQSGNKKYYSNVDIPLDKNIANVIQTKQINKIILQETDIWPETSSSVVRKKVNAMASVDVIKLDGITHILIDKSKFPMENEAICKRKAKDIIKALGLQNEQAVGVIWSDFKTNTINPFVWVKDVDTIYYENACGSGSLAYGIKKATMQKDKNIAVRQKNGKIIDVKVNINNDYIKSASIGGETIIKANKSIDINTGKDFIEISNQSFAEKDGCIKNVVFVRENVSLEDATKNKCANM